MAESQPTGGRVKINVGGTMFETSLSTLKKFENSMLFSLVADRWKGQDELFIDRNPTYFAYVLDYLRDGEYVVLPDDDNSLKCLQREAEFYNLPSLTKMCSAKLQHAANRNETAQGLRRTKKHFVPFPRPDGVATDANRGSEHERNRSEEKGERYSFHGQRSRFDDGASNLQSPHSNAFRIGDKVEWTDFAIETCWLSDYSKRDLVGYKCTACGSYAFGTIIVTPEMMNGKEIGKPFMMDGKRWIPLNYDNLVAAFDLLSVAWTGNGDVVFPVQRTDQGYVVEVRGTCCRVKWDIRGDSHVPQSAIRLARTKKDNYSPLSIN